jgi:hypothetical protein
MICSCRDPNAAPDENENQFSQWLRRPLARSSDGDRAKRLEIARWEFNQTISRAEPLFAPETSEPEIPSAGRQYIRGQPKPPA